MTSKNLEANSNYPTNIVPPNKENLHTMQMLKRLKNKPITGSNDEELLLRVQNLEQISFFSGYSPSRGAKLPGGATEDGAGENQT